MIKRIVPALGLALALAACQDTTGARHLAPIPKATLALMAEKGMTASAPILVRAYKKESELEVWKQGPDGRYALLKTYPICRWSGQLGPKRREGDRQAPEGFYTIGPGQMNPNSSFYLSFDTGYPNAYDRAQGGTGSHLMVHGSCSSRGCFAMTDEAIAEVYAIAREALSGGQRGFQFQAMPFRMTPRNLAQHRHDPNMAFWRQLKEGADVLDATGQEPKVAVCNGRYTFSAGESPSCTPPADPRVADKRARDDQQVAALVAEGTPAIRLAYEDGGQHASFRQAGVGASEGGESATFHAPTRRSLGDVSRPEALASGPREILLEANGKPRPEIALASAAPARTAAAAKPAAKPAPVVALASAEPAATASAGPAVKPAKPSHQHMLGVGGHFTSAEGKPQADRPARASRPVQVAAAEPAADPAPARRAAPTPPKPRPKAAAKPSGAQAVPAPATPPTPERRPERVSLMRGAQPVLPADAAAGFARLN